MPDITNVQAIKFCNEQVRPYADRAAQQYFVAKALVGQWFAQGLDKAIPNDASVVLDGSSEDGRPILTGAAVTNVVTRAMEVIADYEVTGNDKLKAILKPAVNPR